MFSLLPRDNTFFDLFEALTRHVIGSAENLQKLAAAFPAVEAHIARIRSDEHDADDLAHKALDRLDRTFITPFDREDIHELVGGLDDVVDTIDALAKRFPLYHVKQMRPEFVEQTHVLVKAAHAVSAAVHRLRSTRKLSDIQPIIIELHQLENVGDDNNHAAMHVLFDGSTDTLEVLKWKELFDLVESAIDSCEDVGNTLERLMLKNG